MHSDLLGGGGGGGFSNVAMKLSKFLVKLCRDLLLESVLAFSI